MSEHTPGPWMVRTENCAHPELQQQVVHQHPNERFPTLVATVYDSNRVGESIDDTAHLIAAAPDLLEALEWLVRECEESEDTRGNWQDYCAAKDAARAALAKARGTDG